MFQIILAPDTHVPLAVRTVGGFSLPVVNTLGRRSSYNITVHQTKLGVVVDLIQTHRIDRVPATVAVLHWSMDYLSPSFGNCFKLNENAVHLRRSRYKCGAQLFLD